LNKTALWLLLLLPFFYGCATQSVTVQDESAVQQLMERLTSYNESVTAVEAHAILMYTDGERNYSFRAYIAAQNNGEHIRLDLSDLVFKKPVLTLVKADDTVTALMHMQKTGYTMSYKHMDLEEITGLNLRKEILLPALMGKVYVSPEIAELSSTDSQTLRIASDEYMETVIFDDQWRPQRVTYDMGDAAYSMVFKSYTAVEGTAFPDKVTLSNQERKLEATYRDVKVNSLLDEGLFVLDDETYIAYRIENL
jgi:hypothetical protein